MTSRDLGTPRTTSRRIVGALALATFATTFAGAVAHAGSDTTEPPVAEGSAASPAQTADSDLGTILVDSDGMTLYAFLPDAAGSPTCEGDCAANWPPLMTSDIGALDPALFGIVEHADGPMLTVNGWPLYLFAGDAAPGDVNGQGVGDVWFAVAPDGTPIGAPEAAGSTPFVQTAESDLGPILVDADGMTLYAFLPDNASAATCEGDCAANWPPLFVDEPVGDTATSEPTSTDTPSTDPESSAPTATDDQSALAGLEFGDIDVALFTVVAHADGPMLAINGWPLYHFAGDAEPGDVNGQGLGEVWFAVAPDGSPVGAPESVSATTESAGY